MARGGREDPDADDLDLDLEDPFEPPRRDSPAPRRPKRGRPAGLRAWESSEDDRSDEEWDDAGPGRGRFGGTRVPVYWRARDSLYFEPLVALAVVVLLLVGLFAFTNNWPPAYVVESGSMEHASNGDLGVINPGDMVLAQKVANASIVPYVTGARDGVRSYGEYGDVVLYHPNGVTHPTPIVHRAILYLVWDASKQAYSAPDLNGLPCGTGLNRTAGELYYDSGATGGCATTDLVGHLRLYGVGWNSSTIILDLSQYVAIGEHSGYLTKGDHNPEPDQSPTGGGGSTPSLSSLVKPGWVIGIARGEIPWFGAFKLLLDGNAANVSSVSWQFIGLSIVAAIFAAFGVHYALKTEGIESPIRRREEEEAALADEEYDPGEPGRHGFLAGLRAWHPGGGAGDDDEIDDLPPRPARTARSGPVRRSRETVSDAHGRPRPRVRRPSRRHRDEKDDL